MSPIMARNADDTLSSFGVSPTSAALELDYSAMISSLNNHRERTQVFQGFELDDEDEVLCNELVSPVDTMDIFELFHNANESANELRFSQAFGTYEKYITDSGFESGLTREPRRLNDTITRIVNEIQLSENPQNLNLSPSWFCDTEMVTTASTCGRQPIQWDSNGQRCPSPDIFEGSISVEEESMKPYQIINSNKGICKNVKTFKDALEVKEYTSSGINILENDSLHTIGLKKINIQSDTEFNSKSNSCFENTSAEEHIAGDEIPDSFEPEYTATNKTLGFRANIFDTLEAQTLINKSPAHVPIPHPTTAKPEHTNIRNHILCQADVVKYQRLPTGSVNPYLVHSSPGQLINIPEKSKSFPKVFNEDCRADSSNHSEDIHMIQLINVDSNFKKLDKNSIIFENNCLTNFKKPEIINKHVTSKMDIDRNETDLNEVDMDETFIRPFEESQMQMAGQFPHLLSEVPCVPEFNTENVSVDLDRERTVDIDETFSRTFEESQINQAMSSQLPYLFNEKHRYAETKTKNVLAHEEVNSCKIKQMEKLLPTQSGPETSLLAHSTTQPIKAEQIAKDFSECFPKFASVPMKRINLPDPTGEALKDFHIAKIELLILQVLDDLTNHKQIQFVVLKNGSMENCYFDADSQTLKMMDSEKAKTSRILLRDRVALLLSMLAEVYRTLKTHIPCTKRFDVKSFKRIIQSHQANQRVQRYENREMYYSQPELTQSPGRVNWITRDICCMLEAKPWELGVFSSSKGLLAGNIRITLSDDDIIDCNLFAGGMTLPHLTAGIKLIETNAKFVLLVEKDTVFKKLIYQEILKKFKGHCIMVTGRGYPDTNTRIFLKKLWDQHHLPIYALVDADPYGIEIMLVYRFGSIAMSYAVDELAVPAIQWIGVYPSDIKKLELPSMPMELRDNNRLKNLIKRSYISEGIFAELLILQTDGRKTEIEALYKNTSPLYLIDTYLAHRVNMTETRKDFKIIY